MPPDSSSNKDMESSRPPDQGTSSPPAGEAGNNPKPSGNPVASDDEILPADSLKITVENFKEPERKILVETTQKIQSLKNHSERTRLTKDAENEILALDENKGLSRNDREALAQKTRAWFKSHARVRRNDKRFTKIWTGQGVMYELDPETVRKRQERIFKRGAKKTMFGCFAKALDYVWKRLSEETKDQHRATAQLWNQTGPSDEVKSRSVLGTCVLSADAESDV
jgi:hypothetical protein